MVEEVLVAALNGVASISQRVYPAKTPEKAGLPCAVYIQESSESIRAFDGPTGLAKSVYQIIVMSCSYSALVDAVAEVKTAVESINDDAVACVTTSEETPEKYEDEAGVLRAVVYVTVTYYE